MIRVSINGQYNAKIFEQAHGSVSKRGDQGYVLRNVICSNPIVGLLYTLFRTSYFGPIDFLILSFSPNHWILALWDRKRKKVLPPFYINEVS